MVSVRGNRAVVHIGTVTGAEVQRERMKPTSR